MLDLQPGRSVVETFLAAGLDIYMLDWWYPTRKDRYLNLDDHVNGYIDGAVDSILEKHGIDQLNMMAIARAAPCASCTRPCTLKRSRTSSRRSRRRTSTTTRAFSTSGHVSPRPGQAGGVLREHPRRHPEPGVFAPQPGTAHDRQVSGVPGEHPEQGLRGELRAHGALDLRQPRSAGGGLPGVHSVAGSGKTG